MLALRIIAALASVVTVCGIIYLIFFRGEVLMGLFLACWFCAIPIIESAVNLHLEKKEEKKAQEEE